MWLIVALCWVFTAPMLAGTLIVAVLATPLAGQAATWIPIAAALGFVYGIPCARCTAKFLMGPATDDAALRWGWSLPRRSDASAPRGFVPRPATVRRAPTCSFHP
ncbi:MAG: hypothetical protein ABSC22_08665 [Roseiarcus sp.]|jgi:hypothetical protein